METGIDKEKLLRYKAIAQKHLGNPRKLRLTVVSALVLAAVIGIYMPFMKKIERTRKELADAKELNGYITEIESLEKQAGLYQQRLGRNVDTNEWVQYILAGLGAFKVKLRDMESRAPRKVGVYNAVGLSVELEGDYTQLKAFVEWLELSEHLLRIDSLRFEKRPDYLLMKIDILGLAPKSEKKEAKKEEKKDA